MTYEKCTPTTCYCNPNAQWHLAPWHLINIIPEYHFQIDDAKAAELLEDKPDRSYLLTDYNPNRAEGQFTVYIKYVFDQIDFIVKEHKFRFVLPDPHEDYQFHSGDLKNFGNSHLDCFNSTHKWTPIKRSHPHSLTLLCRAAVTKNFTHPQVEYLTENSQIPSSLSKLVLESASTTAPTDLPILFCDDYVSNVGNSSVNLRSCSDKKPCHLLYFVKKTRKFMLPECENAE